MLSSKNKREKRVYENMSEEGGKTKRPDTPHAPHSVKGPVPRWEWEWRTHFCTWLFKKRTLPCRTLAQSESQNLATLRQVLLCGPRARLCRLFTSLPPVRAAAASLSSQMLKSRAHFTPSWALPAGLPCGPVPPAALSILGPLGPWDLRLHALHCLLFQGIW